MTKKVILSSMLVVLSVFAGFAFAAESVSIQKLLFADSIEGLGQYTPRPDTRFTLDDQCKVYLEVSGFATPLTLNTQDEFNINMGVDIKIKLPQSGRKVAFQSDIAKLETKLRSKLTAHFFTFGFTFDGWAPGTYVMEVGVRDQLAGKTVSQDLTFQLVEPTQADIKAKLEKQAQEQAAQQEQPQDTTPAPK